MTVVSPLISNLQTQPFALFKELQELWPLLQPLQPEG
jgi:hypothetical protein